MMPVPGWDEPGFQLINCPSLDDATFASCQAEGLWTSRAQVCPRDIIQ
jgi:hypothetical protein